MANPDGAPIWYELSTPDVNGAQKFYTDVVGLSIAKSEMEGTGDYRILTAPDGAQVGGIMMPPAGAQLKPGWYSYIGVQDVDGTAEKIKQLGGGVLMDPIDIPNIGRFALAADPQGMVFYIMRADSLESSKAFGAETGHFGWNELVTADHKGALDFYGQLFGWENKETMSMGEMGDYCFIDHSGRRLGAVMTAASGWPTRWTYYFIVPSIDAAVGKVKAGGGAIHQGPHEVPGGAFIVLGTDPQGVAFALSGGS